MEPERWQRVKQVLYAALEYGPGERADFLTDTCAGDAALHLEVERLLAAYERADSLFEIPAAEAAARLLAQDHAASMMGRRVGPYKILSLLGAGGMGEVYLAEDTRLGRQVALKLLSSALASDREWLRRFQQEARAAAALNHPNVAHIYEIGAVEDFHFMAMEYIAGQSLDTKISDCPLDSVELVQIAIQIADALEEAHAKGITHRDIKPSNIMITSRGQVKVLDFSLAKMAQLPVGQRLASAISTVVQTAPRVLLGTARYMSPEQARGELTGSATDIFSLGIVLYELATGRHPFSADSQIGVMSAILAQPALRPSRLHPALPASLDALILHMLEKDCRLRPTAAGVRAVLSGLAEQGFGGAPHPAALPVKRHTVGREPEHAELRASYEAAVAGHGRLLCIAGEPGIGKTTLVEDFLNELEGAGLPYSITRGRCSERLAGTEAYLPILEALENLLRSGESESPARLMRLLAPTWYVQIAPLAADDASSARLLAEMQTASQERMKRELSAFFQEFSRTRPLVLFLDDLHWADLSTVDVLAYLASKLQGMRVMIVAAYRPSELLLNQHPFLQVKRDLQARGVCHEIALPFLSRHDIASYLALEFPEHRFPPELPQLIHAKTEGSPLFMVDVVRYLSDQQVIVQAQGRWTLAGSLPDIARELPESVRSMIERKIHQLDQADRRLLVAASVQGYEFDTAVVAQAFGMEAAEVEERLAALERVHAFVDCIGEHEFPDGTPTLRYRFVHVLYQNALYGSLQRTRRAAACAAVAAALVGLYGEQHSAVASELAHLYEAARDFARAADYFRRAAQQASRVFGLQEAVVLARRGLAALQMLPVTRARHEQELALQVVLGNTLMAAKGYAAMETEQTYARAHALCQQLGAGPDGPKSGHTDDPISTPTPRTVPVRLSRQTPHLAPVLWGLYAVHLVRANFHKACELAEEFLRLAEHWQDPAVVVGHRGIGLPSLCLGELVRARERFEQGVSLYDLAQHRALAYLYGHEQGVAGLLNLALALWLLGYPELALQRCQEADQLIQGVQHVNSEAYALYFSAMHYQFRRELQQAYQRAEAAVAFSADQGLAMWSAWGMPVHGWAMVERGQTEEGIAQIRRGLDAAQPIRVEMFCSYHFCLLAEAYGRAGQPQQGLAALGEAQALVEKNDERFWEAELYRLRGELMLQSRAQGLESGVLMLDIGLKTLDTEAETCFRQALAVARRQSAKSLELRAAMSLSRLWQQQGKRQEARELLTDTYAWFTEGFDTADLQAARAQLAELSSR